MFNGLSVQGLRRDIEKAHEQHAEAALNVTRLQLLLEHHATVSADKVCAPYVTDRRENCYNDCFVWCSCHFLVSNLYRKNLLPKEEISLTAVLCVCRKLSWRPR